MLFRIMLVASLYTECRKKAGKIVWLRLLCPSKAVRLRSRTASIHPIEGENMGGIGKKGELPDYLPGKDEDKAKKPPPLPVNDDDIEDGDIATPKRDRYGDDDEPV
jgi:hypothetical protein